VTSIEERQKRNPYIYGVNAPRLETLADFVSAIVCEDENLINYSLWEARQDQSKLVAVFLPERADWLDSLCSCPASMERAED
jgi:hypothetical protein